MRNSSRNCLDDIISAEELLRWHYKCLLNEQWMEQTSNPREEEVVKALFWARDAMLEIRHHMHLMGEAAGIPVGSLYLDSCLLLFSFFSFLVVLSLFLCTHTHQYILLCICIRLNTFYPFLFLLMKILQLYSFHSHKIFVWLLGQLAAMWMPSLFLHNSGYI